MSINPGDEKIKTLYKYRRLEGETGDEICKYTMNMLEKGELFFAKSKDFNDPFDSKIDYDINVTELERRTSYEKRGWPSEVIDFYRANDEFNMASFIDENRDGCDDLMNIFCLSKKSNDTLMWSHYAANHTGICIGFKVHHSKNGLNIKVKPGYVNGLSSDNLVSVLSVIYSDVRPSPYNIFRDHKEIGPFLITKDVVWKYEDEARVILVNDQLLKDQLLKKKVYVEHEEISEIIFGCKASKEFEKKVVEIIKNYPEGGSKVKIYKLVMVPGKYELEKVPYDDFLKG